MVDKTLFGTDGIRGKYGETLTGDIAYRLGNTLARDGGDIVVGRDTRLSGGELYKYLKKGILDAGGNIIYLGIVPTPLVAHAVTMAGARYGIVITASHNPPEYNGLKVFSSSGMKIDDREESRIENEIFSHVFVAKNRGSESYGESYIETYKNCLNEAFFKISGLNIGIDMGNGALSTLARSVYFDIIPSVTCINAEGNGALINMGSGALHPEGLIDIVRERHLDMGFAFDGDGDRIIAVTHDGNVVNGDMMLYAIAIYLKSNDALSNNIVVGTPYTNMGIEHDLKRHGIDLIRSDVGDSNVALEMKRSHASVGGERAGHIILSQYGMTGDALLVSLYLAMIVTETDRTLADITACHEYPTFSGDFMTYDGEYIISKSDDIMSNAKARLGDIGRIIVRASGTEPKVRVMVECEDATLGRDVLDDVVQKLKEL